MSNIEDQTNPGFFNRLFHSLSSPGRQYAVQSSAPSQFINKSSGNVSLEAETVSTCIIDGDIPDDIWIYNEANKKSWGSRLFDSITECAGTTIAFCISCFLIIIWAVAGVVFGAPDVWQIVMQDASSIQCYISDTLLMRQQHNQTKRVLTIIAQLRSRCTTVDRLIKLCYTNINRLSPGELDELAHKMPEDKVGDAVHLPTETRFDICCNWASEITGSLYSLITYFAGIMVWIAMGKQLEYSDLWQLYINTAVAVVLTFTSMFLQNTRRRHMLYLEKCIRFIKHSDTELELILRQATNDNTPNPLVSINPKKVSFGIRTIDYYGDIVGTGIGAFISLCVFIAWFAIGDLLEWSDDWWLIIGTYTGLIGFIDGFVLRNVYFRQDTLLTENFDKLADSDLAIFQYINLPPPEKYKGRKISFSERLSNWMGDLCARPIAVLVSVLIVLGLVIYATIMHWNTTAQLICNTPTMILEGFLLIVLLQAHNMANTTRRIQMHNIFLRRIKLLEYIRLATGINEKHECHLEKDTKI